MAKKEEHYRERRSKRERKEEGPTISLFQGIIGVLAILLAVNMYISYYPLQKGVLEGFLIVVGVYQLVRAMERRAYSHRLDVLKRRL